MIVLETSMSKLITSIKRTVPKRSKLFVVAPVGTEEFSDSSALDIRPLKNSYTVNLISCNSVETVLDQLPRHSSVIVLNAPHFEEDLNITMTAINNAAHEKIFTVFCLFNPRRCEWICTNFFNAGKSHFDCHFSYTSNKHGSTAVSLGISLRETIIKLNQVSGIMEEGHINQEQIDELVKLRDEGYKI